MFRCQITLKLLRTNSGTRTVSKFAQLVTRIEKKRRRERYIYISVCVRVCESSIFIFGPVTHVYCKGKSLKKLTPLPLPPLFFCLARAREEDVEGSRVFLGARANIESIGDRLAKVQMYIGT